MKTPGYHSSRGWVFRLPDPFHLMPWYPLDAGTLADLLQVSLRTAQRICQGTSRLRHGELVYLQVMVFGLIPDNTFVRQRVYFQGGRIRSHNDPGIDASAAELVSLVLDMRMNGVIRSEMREKLAQARARVRELEAEIQRLRDELPANVVRFPARSRRGPDDAA